VRDLLENFSDEKLMQILELKYPQPFAILDTERRLEIHTALMSLNSDYFIVKNHDNGFHQISHRSPWHGIRNFFSVVFESFLGMYFESGILNKYHRDRIVNENVMIIYQYVTAGRHKIFNVYANLIFCKDRKLGPNCGRNNPMPERLKVNNFFSLFVACGILLASAFIINLMEIVCYFYKKYCSE